MVDSTNKLIHSIQFIALIIGILLGAFLWATRVQNVSLQEFFLPGTPVVHIGEIPLRVEIAETPEQRARGLSGRDELKDGKGMLFVFPEPGYHSIWMKDMYFPIDIIWISEDFKVVSVNDNVSPDSYPRTFRPQEPAKYVVETNTLYLETFGITEGMAVRMPFEYLAD